MCSYSMVADHYKDLWNRPYGPANPINPNQTIQYTPLPISPPPITREEFETLRRQVDEMLMLLKRAVKYDEANNEPECELEEKKDLLRKVAKLVGVDFDKEMGAVK
jgi:hypothetical protein